MKFGKTKISVFIAKLFIFHSVNLIYLKGPVTYDNNGRETVVGVVSWDSITPLEPGTMSVYARVTAVLRWIKKEMKTNYDRC